ncbi:glutaredoxin family protein [Haliea sp. AH-315-K21]|uniref:Glutaredoxin n=1 Tax=SAR86 cluster bacterium TaxID=2030880 RepID=A0A2A5CEG6_9GAMM|nr:glutaredoxin family protein [Haliea sp. AH-315-K21]MBN4075172.1 glutaredoxin family protein [Gammaproteobacteria bacterium AH-315-E17]PCJ42123.1 MAG: glutaredoxin [SAR86 cluster bacterium]
MPVLNLYTTLGCHLCDEAAAMVSKQRVLNLNLALVEISESEILLGNYGVRIPVLKFQDGTAELAWPFTDEELSTFLASSLLEITEN